MLKTAARAEAWAAERLVRNDIVFLLVGIALIGISLMGALNLRISTDNRSFFGEENPQYQAYLEQQDTYSKQESVFFAVSLPGEPFSVESLEAMRRLTQDAWQVPYTLRVDSVANYDHSYAEEDEIFVEPLIPEDAVIDAASASRAKEIALNSRELVNRHVSSDGRTFGLGIQVVPPENSEEFLTEIDAVARELVAQWRAEFPGIEIHHAGSVAISLAFNQATIIDLIQRVPVAFGAVMFLLLIGLGTLSGLIATIAVVVGGTISALGYAGWAEIELIPATAISPLAVIVLLAASCVHIILAWQRAMKGGEARAGAVETSYKENLWPVLVANATTAFGFLCLNFSEAPPLRDLGNIVCVGLLVGWLQTMLIVPFFLKRLPVLRVPRVQVSETGYRKLAEWILRNRSRILIGFGVILALALTGISKIGFEDNFLRYFDRSFEIRRSIDAIEDKLTGANLVQYSIESPSENGVFDPDFLKDLDRFVSWIETQDKVAYVGAITHVVKRLNQSMNGDDPAFHTIGQSGSENAQFVMFYELSLPLGRDLNSMLDVDRRKTLVSVSLAHASSSDIRAIAAASDAWFAENAPHIATKPSDLDAAFAEVSKRNNRAMLLGMFVVLILVSATMIFTLGSVRLGLISLVPNLVPAVLAFGIWGWFVGDVNLGSTVVTTMTFGIVVDDTVHMLMRYMRSRRSGLGPDESLAVTLTTVGAALTLTSVAIMSGFAIMALSGFAINSHIGGLTFLVICVALFADLILLPSVLKWMEK